MFRNVGIISIMFAAFLLAAFAASAVECEMTSDCSPSEFKHPECVRCIGGSCVMVMCNLYCEHGYVPGSCQCSCRDSPCDPKWKCTRWSRCMDGERTRTCYDINECGTDEGNPRETRPCWGWLRRLLSRFGFLS